MQKSVRSFSRGFFPGAVRFLVLALAVVLSAGVASAQSVAYVAFSNNNDVAPIDTATNPVTATVPVGNAPGAVGALPDGDFVYVATSNASSSSARRKTT